MKKILVFCAVLSTLDLTACRIAPGTSPESGVRIEEEDFTSDTSREKKQKPKERSPRRDVPVENDPFTILMPDEDPFVK